MKGWEETYVIVSGRGEGILTWALKEGEGPTPDDSTQVRVPPSPSYTPQLLTRAFRDRSVVTEMIEKDMHAL
jgi:hypothetical protein